ncbi:MAG TPA: hypothetical protein VKX45_08765 [Bryobacteraceae bacterium]|jgi:hypothetical protein|nr:hypothetical protein [Bryobacteraceae bacterium]
MPIAKITGQGLAAIAFSVALLWGCLIGERIERRSAQQDFEQVLRRQQILQQRWRPLPVSTPSPLIPFHPRVTAG